MSRFDHCGCLDSPHKSETIDLNLPSGTKNSTFYHSKEGKAQRKEDRNKRKEAKEQNTRKKCEKYYKNNIKPLLIEASLNGETRVTFDTVDYDVFCKKRYRKFFSEFLKDEGLTFEYTCDPFTGGSVTISW